MIALQLETHGVAVHILDTHFRVVLCQRQVVEADDTADDLDAVFVALLDDVIQVIGIGNIAALVLPGLITGLLVAAIAVKGHGIGHLVVAVKKYAVGLVLKVNYEGVDVGRLGKLDVFIQTHAAGDVDAADLVVLDGLDFSHVRKRSPVSFRQIILRKIFLDFYGRRRRSRGFGGLGSIGGVSAFGNDC